jgi:outer membrane protein assembly factor BamE (lipoprotein component of BamABCDE complex)
VKECAGQGAEPQVAVAKAGNVPARSGTVATRPVLRPGESKAQVVGMLGKPNSVSDLGSGNRTIWYFSGQYCVYETQDCSLVFSNDGLEKIDNFKPEYRDLLDGVDPNSVGRSAGRPVLRAGQTKAQVVSMLGTPASVSDLGSGDRIIWYYSGQYCVYQTQDCSLIFSSGRLEKIDDFKPGYRDLVGQ